MEMRDFIVIGGVIIGFLILIFGILVLRKMKKESSGISSDNFVESKSDVSRPFNDLDTESSDLFINQNSRIEDASSEILNDEVKLSNSSLDSEIVSKPSSKTDEDFLVKEEASRVDRNDDESNEKTFDDDISFENLDDRINPIKINKFPYDNDDLVETNELSSDNKNNNDNNTNNLI